MGALQQMTALTVNLLSVTKDAEAAGLYELVYNSCLALHSVNHYKSLLQVNIYNILPGKCWKQVDGFTHTGKIMCRSDYNVLHVFSKNDFYLGSISREHMPYVVIRLNSVQAQVFENAYRDKCLVHCVRAVW